MSIILTWKLLYSTCSTQSLLIFVVVLCRYIQYRWQKRHIYNLTKRINGPRPLPFIGNVFLFFGNSGKILTKIINLLNKWGCPMKVTLGSELIIFFSKPEHIKLLLTKTLDKGKLYKYVNEPLKTGLLSAPASIWRKHRKTIQPTFSQKVLESYFSVFEEQSLILTKVLEKEANGKYFNVFPYIINCAFDSICDNALGIQMNSQSRESKFTYHTTRVTNILYQRTLKFWLHPNFIFNLTSLAKDFYESMDYLKNFCLTIIREQRGIFAKTKDNNNIEKVDCEFDKHIGKRKPFSQLLIETTDLDNDELYDEILTVTTTGSDTIATTVSFTLITLGIHQDLQRKVYEELDDIFNDSSRPILVSDLPKLKYMEMFIKETMRIFTIVPFIARVVTEEFSIDEYILPKGCNVCVPIIHTHHDPNIWPNPKQFDPERFLPENCVRRHPYSFIPFSNGPRNCIGINYAYMFMKLILANILRKYTIHCDMKIEDIKVHIDIALKASDGFNIKMRKR